jgi:hypothetical protein
MGQTETSAARPAGSDAAARTAFLVASAAGVPDGTLLASAKYPGEPLSADEAVARAFVEAKETRQPIPVEFLVPAGVCVLRLGPDFALLGLKCMDAPQFRPREVVNQFWFSATHYKAKLITFRGRTFDLPLLELAAFRHGISARDYYLARDRYRGPLDLTDWFTNYGACDFAGGLDVLAKLVGKPGRADATGERTYRQYRAGDFQAINDGCLCDALDTYFVFLRTRILTGDITREQEAELAAKAKAFLAAKTGENPVLSGYLNDWTESAA